MVIPKREALILNFGEEDGNKLYEVLKGIKPPQEYRKVEAWVRQCHNEPRSEEMKLCACDEILNTCGTEAIRAPDYHIDHYHLDIVAVYCNTGDSYAKTILFETERARFVITSWGDWIESSPSKYKLNTTE
jgi:hypothetical protein